MNGNIKDKNRALIRLVYEKTRSDGPQSMAPLLDSDFVARVGWKEAKTRNGPGTMGISDIFGVAGARGRHAYRRWFY